MSTYPAKSLTIGQREQYLYDRGYFQLGSITEAHRRALERINFHYFLGYARNYRGLVDQGHIASSKRPENVLALIDHDHEIASVLFAGLRRAEWHLRSLIVESYCDRFDAAGSFLMAGQFVVTTPGSNVRMVEQILDSALRYREPFVADHIDDMASTLSCDRPTAYDRARHDLCVSLVEDLPLWSLIDSFSLGLLSRFITDCAPLGAVGAPPWKRVAAALDINNGMFPTNLKALVFLRNLVAHHARIWMRTTADTPRKPNCFKRELRPYHDKSMGVSFYNLALFQGKSGRDAMATKLDAMARSTPDYFRGVSKLVR